MFMELGLSDPPHDASPHFSQFLTLFRDWHVRRGLEKVCLPTLCFFNLTVTECCREQSWLFRKAEQTFGLRQAYQYRM